MPASFATAAAMASSDGGVVTGAGGVAEILACMSRICCIMACIAVLSSVMSMVLTSVSVPLEDAGSDDDSSLELAAGASVVRTLRRSRDDMVKLKSSDPAWKLLLSEQRTLKNEGRVRTSIARKHEPPRSREGYVAGVRGMDESCRRGMNHSQTSHNKIPHNAGSGN